MLFLELQELLLLHESSTNMNRSPPLLAQSNTIPFFEFTLLPGQDLAPCGERITTLAAALIKHGEELHISCLARQARRRLTGLPHLFIIHGANISL